MEEIAVLTSPAAPVKAAARALSTVGNPLLAYFTSLVRCEPPPLPGDSVLPQSFVASRLYGHHIFPRNLATQETLSMLPTDSLTQTTTVRALHALNKHGCCLLRGVLTEAEVSLASAAVESLFERQQAVEKARRASRQTPGAWMLQEDDMAEQAPFIEVAPGRFHLDGWKLGYTEPLSWLRIWAPSVRLHDFVRQFFVSSMRPEDSNAQVPEIRCHDLQAIVSAPGSESQSWHSDNSARGLTVIVALVDITSSNGPTQLWPHVHELQFRKALARGPIPPMMEKTQQGSWDNIQREIAQASNGTAAANVDCSSGGGGGGGKGHGPGSACKPDDPSSSSLMTLSPSARSPRTYLRAGDAIVFDSRMLHRGLANVSQETRPVLVWQFTDVATPPPGQGIMGSVGRHKLTQALGTLKQWLDGTAS